MCGTWELGARPTERPARRTTGVALWLLTCCAASPPELWALASWLCERYFAPWTPFLKVCVCVCVSVSMRDAENPPLASRDTWSAIQCVLHSAISKQQLTAPVDHCHSQFYLCRPRVVSCSYRPDGNAHSVFSLKLTAAELCGPAATTPLPTTSTTLTTLCYSCLLTPSSRQPCSPVPLTLTSSTYYSTGNCFPHPKNVLAINYLPRKLVTRPQKIQPIK